MHFGKTLQESIYPPWKTKYIDYAKLQRLLREDESDEDGSPWTEEDETRFCDEIFNVQLEKVTQFQQERFDALRARIDAALSNLGELAPESAKGKEVDTGATTTRIKELKAELDDILKEVRELKRYSNINYTGFLKIVKKHDRKRRNIYPIRPMTQLRLAERPFNSESSYRPLLDKLDVMYTAIREQLEGEQEAPVDVENPSETHNGERYTAYKFWVHPDNLFEVETFILPRLPALVYSQQSAKELDGHESPAITSLYFDNKDFELYSEKVDRQSDTSSLRLRWYGNLSTKPDVFVELKTADGQGNSQEKKFVIKEKNIKPFINGENITEKLVQKMERQGHPAEKIEEFKTTITKIQGFLQQKSLSPVIRANYTRRAFQKPADDRVRISIDNDLAFIREDTLDPDRPCRDPNEWHRLDIDEGNISYPFKNINQSEVSKFPYAILEIKLKEDGNRKRPTWIEDLMTSHLVHRAPKFSKFVHGVASLFEDNVNNLPMWLSDLQSDIRKDPQKAFQEEEQRRAQRAEDAMVVGSLAKNMSASYKAAQSSPVGQSYLQDRMTAESSAQASRSLNEPGPSGGDGADQSSQDQQKKGGYGTLSSVLPGFSLTKYSRAKRAQREATLPEGVVEPEQWIKNMGELKVEPKVWLANERTFLKWQHVCLLQGALAVGLYSAAGGNILIEVMGIIYLAIAVFTGVWGYAMLRVRRKMILERSGKDFDNMVGPVIISISIMIALVVNFVLQWRAAFERMDEGNSTQIITDELL
ncbi:VTC domain-containing protein [Stachybotrys elegans]|uniref:VTC domain-containing protein n=1 Tax=Stachybotrys elegans TaxID=80388 RepID=A0A8K0WT92_9HYPO|nr:VTC domain-containing protein [Stachybotrys elegans]